jgi:hypothetical protein
MLISFSFPSAEFASDIAVVHWHPTLAKRVTVTLLHSRARPLPRFDGGGEGRERGWGREWGDACGK